MAHGSNIVTDKLSQACRWLAIVVWSDVVTWVIVNKFNQAAYVVQVLNLVSTTFGLKVTKSLFVSY